MKVALALSGQPRSYKEGFKYHKKNLLDHYNVEVYMHTWDYVDNETKADLVELYGEGGKRKVALYTDHISEERLKEIDEEFTNIPDPQFPARNTYQMWHSISTSITMAYMQNVQSYQLNDVIVRSRYDFALNIIPPLEETRVDTIYVPADRMTKDHDFCADMFAWGTNIVMLKYGGTFKNMPRFYEYGVKYIGEDMLAAQLRRHGLTGKQLAYVNMNNPFPPGPYNGNWHSMIRDDFRDWNTLRG